MVILAVALLVQLVALYAPSTPGVPDVPDIDKLVHASIFAAPTFAALAAGWHAGGRSASWRCTPRSVS